MEAVNITIKYEPAATTREFGHYILSFTGLDGTQYSVKLKFGFDELRCIAQDTSSIAFDFLIFSLSVYNADRAISRAIYSEEGWCRRMKLTVPVLHLSEMNNSREALTSALNFLTGDDWELNFEQAEPYQIDQELPIVDRSVYGRVSLFSGGLDSLIGFVDGCALLEPDKKILLVSHKELGKEWSDQVRILDDCKKHQIYTGKYEQLLVNAGINNQGWISQRAVCESTFRARSILFMGAGIYCAHAINPYMPLIIPENGTISLNIPLDQGRRSACSTRTTHPVFMKRLQEALTLMGINNKLENPYQLKSKADMMMDCCEDSAKKAALAVLYKDSCSCAKRSHKKSWKRRRDKNGKPILHCGFCLPCIYRRVALDAVGWGKKEPVGVNVFNVNEIGLSNPEIRKSRDFKALLYFLRKRYNRDTIEGELIANGVYEKQELEEYTTFLLNSYNQVKAWVGKYGNAQIKRLAGI